MKQDEIPDSRAREGSAARARRRRKRVCQNRNDQSNPTHPFRQRYPKRRRKHDGIDTLMLEEEDARILYKAMQSYTPTKRERELYEILLETLEEIVTRDLYMDDDE